MHILLIHLFIFQYQNSAANGIGFFFPESKI